MNIVKQKWEFLNGTLPVVPKKIKTLYLFGISVLAFRQVVSMRSNSRLLDLKWHTAKSKAYRITINKIIPGVFPTLVTQLCIIRRKDTIAIDFSDFKGFQVLMFAKQTKQGRTVPIYFEILEYPIQKGSQNKFVINSIKNFTKLVGFKPVLVFDRGFACPSIIQYLSKNKHRFVIRIKKCKSVVDVETGEMLLVKNSSKNDFRCVAYKRKLRIVISDKPEESDPWYLVTNDFKSTRNQIIKTYYHRFEIEEFFRDAKRLLGLEYVKFKKQGSLAVVLWFLMLGIWFLWSIDEKQEDIIQRNKMKLSRMRYYFEMMQKEIFIATESQYLVDS
jgi:hypothetical protein